MPSFSRWDSRGGGYRRAVTRSNLSCVSTDAGRICRELLLLLFNLRVRLGSQMVRDHLMAEDRHSSFGLPL